MSIKRDNYYILLGLNVDPPVTDAGQIKAALRAKKQEWTRWQEHPLKRNDGLAFLGEASKIERVMLDPVLREKEALAAARLKCDMLVQFEAELRVLEAKGYILPREVSAILSKYKAFGFTEELVLNRAKCPVSETPPVPRDDDAGEILDRVTARNIARGLRILGFSTLYTFLDEPQYSSVKNLTAAAERIRRTSASQGGKTPQAAISAELSGICASLFESIASKQKYDRYIKISKYPAVGELLDEEAVRSGYISPDVMIRMIHFAVEKYGLKILDAEEYIKSYCAAYGIALDQRGVHIPCPNCGNKMPKSSPFCTACSQPFSGACPECGEPFEGGGLCGVCGFRTGHMGKASGYIAEAGDALIEKNWSAAQKALLYVHKYWPRHPKLESLEKQAALLESRHLEWVRSVEAAVARRCLYAAQESIGEAALEGVKLPAPLVKNVAVEIAAFEKRVETLFQQGEPAIEALLKLSADVKDSAELTRLLAFYPPDPPSVFSAEIFGAHIALSWGESPSMHTETYLLVRKRNSPPLTAFDGDLLYEGSAHSFTDQSAQPLTAYRYSLFSRRAGTYSRAAAQVGPLMIVPEIQNLKLLPMDSGARLSWDFNPSLSAVKIWRKRGGEAPKGPGEGVLLPNDRLDGFSDSQLENDVEYWYYIVAGYAAEGAPVLAQGIFGAVVPRRLIAPVEELHIAEADGCGDYIVSWNAEAHSDILMFCTVSRPDFSEGDVFLAEDLLTQYRKLDLDYKNAGSAHFNFKFSGGLYLFAAFVFGRFATVSEPRYIVSVPDVQNQACDVIGDSLYINVKWPVSVSDILVAYRFDRFPKLPDEAGAAVVTCSRNQYDLNAAVVINDPAPKTYHCVIFSEFTSPTGQKVYSKGARLLVNNRPQQEISYGLTYRKKRFSDAGVLEVTLSCAEELIMPGAVITGRVGRMPLSRSDGLQLFELKKGAVISNSLTLQLNTAPLPANLFLRLFFDDAAMYQRLRLIPVTAARIS